jgi:hypothetical protein
MDWKKESSHCSSEKFYFFNNFKLRKGQDESDNQHAIQFYKRFLPIANHDVFKKGDWTFIDSTVGSLLTWRFQYKNYKRLVVINYSDSTQSGRVKIDNLTGSGQIKLTDLLTGRGFVRDADELRNAGLLVSVSRFTGEIYEYE